MKTATLNPQETPENDEIDEILNGAANYYGEPPEGFEINYSEIPPETLQLWADEEESKRLYRLAVKEGRMKDF